MLALAFVAAAVSNALAEDHPHQGPHKGALVELGKEEYHAEIVHNDEQQTITVYILDSSAKKAVAIEGKEIVINVKHGNKGEQFRLASNPDKGDAKGLSSRFSIKNKELCEHLDEEGADVRLSLKIKGAAFIAKIAHEHEEKN